MNSRFFAFRPKFENTHAKRRIFVGFFAVLLPSRKEKFEQNYPFRLDVQGEESSHAIFQLAAPSRLGTVQAVNYEFSGFCISIQNSPEITRGKNIPLGFVAPT